VDLEEHMEVALECWIHLEERVGLCLVEHSSWDTCLMDMLTLELAMSNYSWNAPHTDLISG
jgi:hypothetical protein